MGHQPCHEARPAGVASEGFPPNNVPRQVLQGLLEKSLDLVRWNLEWLPFLALIVIAFEVVKFTIMLVVFRHRNQQHKSLCDSLPSDSLETDRTCRNPWIFIASNRLDELAELSQNTWPDRISPGLEKHA